MNTYQDTIATLLPDAKKMVRQVLKLSERMFADHGAVDTCAFAWYADSDKMDIIPVPPGMMSPEEKHIVWTGMAALRRAIPIVGFVFEVWMSHPKPEEVNPDGSVKVMPSDDPNRTEHLMFQLWQGRRAVTFMAEIKRKPDRLGEWEIMFDTDFPPSGKADRVEGAMMEGEPFPLEDN